MHARDRVLQGPARLVGVAHEAVRKGGRAAVAVARAAARAALDVLEDEVVQGHGDHEASTHVGPVGGADDGVVDHALGRHVARAHEAHVAGARAARVAEREDGHGVAHDGHACALEVRRRVARDLGEARGRGRQSLGARRPRDATHVRAARALRRLHGLDLHGAAVDAQGQARVVDGVPEGVEGRQPLGPLERDGAGVLEDKVALGRAEDLRGVVHDELVELLVKVVEALPDALVHHDGHGELVGGVDVLDGLALEGHARRERVERRLARGDELEGRLGRHRVDVADAIAGLHELEADAIAPLGRQRLDNASRPAHFFGWMTTVGQMTGFTWSVDGQLTGRFVWIGFRLPVHTFGSPTPLSGPLDDFGVVSSTSNELTQERPQQTDRILRWFASVNKGMINL